MNGWDPFRGIPEPRRSWVKVAFFSGLFLVAWKTAFVGRSTDTYRGQKKKVGP